MYRSVLVQKSCDCVVVFSFWLLRSYHRVLFALQATAPCNRVTIFLISDSCNCISVFSFALSQLHLLLQFNLIQLRLILPRLHYNFPRSSSRVFISIISRVFTPVRTCFVENNNESNMREYVIKTQFSFLVLQTKNLAWPTMNFYR